MAGPIDDVEGAYVSSAAERDLVRLLAGRRETPAFIIHYRQGGAAERGLGPLEAMLAERWGKVCARLELKTARKLQVFVYDSAAEMGRLTGRPAEEAAAIGESLHVAVDRPVLGAALAKAAESEWGRAGDKLGGGLQGGRWYRLKVSSRAGRLEVSVDDRKLSVVPVPAAAGGMGFGVEEGRIGIRGLKIRPAPADPDAPVSAPWTFALRGEAEKTWTPDVPGRWRVADEEIEGVRYGRWSRIRSSGQTLKDLELECELRLAEGASGEVALHAQPSGAATRIIFAPGAVFVATAEGRRPITGPHPTLREGFAEAIAAEIDGVPVKALSRVLLDAGLVPPVGILRLGFPARGMDRYRRQVLVGSFVLDALEQFGPARYRDLHFADLFAPKTPLGDLGELEGAWRKRLKALPIEPAEVRRAERRLGLDLLADGSKWRDLTQAMLQGRFKVEGAGRFTASEDGLEWRAGGAIQGAGRAHLAEPATARTAVRATVRFGEGSRVRITLKARDGRTSGALLSLSGANLVTPDNTIVGKSDFGLVEGRSYDVVLALEGGEGRLYLDGVLVAEAASGLAAGPGKIAIEVEGKTALVQRVALRAVD